MTAARPSGRGWAYAGAVLGGAVSIAANVGHSYVPPPSAPANWSPPVGAVIGAVFWPLALFVAVEIFARIAWPEGSRWTALRFCGLLPVALVAAVVSYRHLSGLLTYYREDGLTAVIGPLAVDGLMVMATGALIATGARRVSAPAVEPAAAEPIAEPVVVEPSASAPVPDEMPPPAETPDATEPPAVEEPVITARRRTTPRSLTAEQRVIAAHAKHPDATHARIAEMARASVSTVKRYRPKTGSPIALSPATTPVLADAA